MGAYAPESASSSLCLATVAAASWPLPTCTGNVGIGGTSGISSGAPLWISASSSAFLVAEVGQRGRVRG
jgi:hypothetical protein